MPRITKMAFFFAPVLLALLAAGDPAFGAGAARIDAKRDEPSAARSVQPTASSEVRQYCTNIVAAASAARVGQQQKQLEELERRLQQRLSELEAKRVELQELLDRYDAFEKKADQTLTGVFSRMKPDAAAAQLANLDEDAAAALLLRLRPQNSSAIMNEMDAFHGALLAKKIASFSTLKHGDKKL